jgi:tyrosinase-like protein
LKGTTHTVRAPDENGQTDDLYINSYISNHIQGELGIGLYKVLNLRQNWDGFSNDVLDARAQVEASKHHVQYVDHSLEGFHDNIHVVLGQGRLRNGSGHLGYPQYAAFDPLFWFV